MMRIWLDSPALIAVRGWLAGQAAQQPQRSDRTGRRKAARTQFRTEQLEPRMMLDAGMRARLPDLVAASDTGASDSDNLTHDRTPTLTGSVRGDVSQVRLLVDGQRVAVLPVVNGTWTHTVPAEAALLAGKHTVAVRPVDSSGKAGTLSKPLDITVRTTLPTPPTLFMGKQSDTGVKGDGQTTYATPVLRGVAQPGRQVIVSIDGEVAGRVKSDAKTGAWSFKAPRLANGEHDVTAVAENLAGLQSEATSFQVTVNGERTVMLDATNGQTVELTASHLLGQGSQGFIVTQVQRGTLQQWSAAKNAWVTIPKAPIATDAATLGNAQLMIRRTLFNTAPVRWTPGRGDVGMAPAFTIVPLDKAGGATAPIPGAGTVPGIRIKSPVPTTRHGLPGPS